MQRLCFLLDEPVHTLAEILHRTEVHIHIIITVADDIVDDPAGEDFLELPGAVVRMMNCVYDGQIPDIVIFQRTLHLVLESLMPDAETVHKNELAISDTHTVLHVVSVDKKRQRQIILIQRA